MSTNSIALTLDTPATGRFQSAIRHVGQAALVALGFAIPLSTSGAEILVAVAAGCWLLAGDFLKLRSQLIRTPAAAWCLAMYGLLLAGASHGPSGTYDVVKTLAKYREFLYVPLFLTAFAAEPVRRWGLRAFLAGVLVMVGLSYAEWIGRFDIGHLSSTDFVIYKDRISHALLVAFAMYLMAHHAISEQRYRFLRLAFLPLGAFNILFLVQGRTGHLVMSLLALLLAFQRWGIRGLVIGSVLLAAFWGSVYKLSPVVQQRIQSTMVQFQDHFGEEQKRNDDARLEFYAYSLRIIRQNPIVGTGTGGFLHAYREIARMNGVPATEDPHSEYLLLAVQLGVFGPLGLLALFSLAARSSRSLPPPEQYLAQGLIVTLASGCLVNSLMYGFTGGLMFGYFAALAFATPSDLQQQDNGKQATDAPSIPLRRAA